MPQITVDDEHLGGLSDLLKLARAGGVERLARAEPEPWVQIKRRIGRGYDVVVLDSLGRTISSQRAPGRRQADQLVEAAAGIAGSSMLMGGDGLEPPTPCL